MSFKGVIFDLDGVLVDTVPLHYAAWHRMFTEYGYAFDEKIYREKVDGRPRLDGVRGVMHDVGPAQVTEAGDRKQAYYLEMIAAGKLKAFESSLRFIAELRRHQIMLAAASSSINARLILETIGVLYEFAAVVTSADIIQGKPDPEIFLTAAACLDLSEAECVVIEDAQAGIQAAKRGGFFCVGVNRQAQPEYFLEADVVVEDIGELGYASLEQLFEQRDGSIKSTMVVDLIKSSAN